MMYHIFHHRTVLLFIVFSLHISVTSCFIHSGFLEFLFISSSLIRDNTKKLTVLSSDRVDHKSTNKNNRRSDSSKVGVLDRRQIPLQTQLTYAREGHGVLRSFLSEEYINELRADLVTFSQDKERILQAYKQKVIVASPDGMKLASSCNSVQECKQVLQKLNVPADDLPFLQFFNCWRYLSSIERLCKSPLMSSAAAQLLGVEKVRLYQDSLFHKRTNDGQTPWHSDARMAPFDTSTMITFWIPLQKIPTNGSGLIFVSKSHSDFALPYWNGFDSEEFQRLDVRYGNDAIQNYMPLDVGDVTIHSGWTLHCANGNKADTRGRNLDRYALAISYVDARAEVRADVPGVASNIGKKSNKNKRSVANYKKELRDDEDRSSYSDWIGDVKPRISFEHKLVPIVWPIANARKNEKPKR